MDIVINGTKFSIQPGDGGFYLTIYNSVNKFYNPDSAFKVLENTSVMEYLDSHDRSSGIMPEVPMAVYKKFLLWT